MNLLRPLSLALSACAKDAPSGRPAALAAATSARHVVFLHMADSHAQLETHLEFPLTVHQALRTYLEKHPVITPAREGRATAVDLPKTVFSQDAIVAPGEQRFSE